MPSRIISLNQKYTEKTKYIKPNIEIKIPIDFALKNNIIPVNELNKLNADISGHGLGFTICK